MEKRLPPAPPALKKHGKKFWKAICSQYALGGEEFMILEGTCANLDQFYECKEVIEREGYIMSSERGHKVRPEVQAGKEAWRSFLLGAKFLRIDETEEEKKPKKIGRPPGPSWYRREIES
jgi:hypothetical protein